MLEITINSKADLPQAAKKLLVFAENASVFAFFGEMAAGKTTFIADFCRLLGIKDSVQSPTYALVNEYLGANGRVYHFDLYRLKHLAEALDIGIEEYLASKHYCLIEWPELILTFLPQTWIKIEIKALPNDSRVFTFTKMQS